MSNGLILGFFDGVHIAHQAVIKSAVNFVDNPILITFKDSPAEFFQKDYEYIYPRKYSLDKIKSLGVKEVVEYDFESIADISAEDYLNSLIEKYSPKSISTGFNHTFGKNRLGNPEFLEQASKKYGFRYFCIPEEKFNEKAVSSTLVKSLLKSGDIEQANNLLKTNFFIEGIVIKGAQIGRKIGFPTANINYPQKIVQVPYGVYAAEIDGRKGILNWGIKPTVNNTKEPIAEVHILNFNEDIYGKTIKINLLKKIRDEKKFNNLDELKEQINEDISVCLKL